MGRADAGRRIGERPCRLPGGARWLDASRARSYRKVTNQGRCGMSSSSGTDISSLAKGGPATQEGKEAVKWNATRHGIRSPAPVVAGVENREDWEEHRDGVLQSLQPEGHLELVLAERVALLSWRLHRVTRYETESIALYQEKAQEDLAKQRGRPFSDVSGPASPEVVRSNLKSARMDLKLLKRFARVGDEEPLSGLDAANILWEVAEHTDAVAEGEAEAEELLENLSVPGLKEGTSPEEFEGWTAGLLQRAVEQIASSADREGHEAVLEAVMRSAEWKVKKAKQAAEEVERDLERMGRERPLPDEKTLEKVTRYEAHLYKALHKLEALQVRQTGGTAPLARLDVDGLAGS